MAGRKGRQRQGSRRTEGLRNDLWGGFSRPTAQGQGAASWGVATRHKLHAELPALCPAPEMWQVIAPLGCLPGPSCRTELGFTADRHLHAPRTTACSCTAPLATAAAEGLTELTGGVTAFLAMPRFSGQGQRCSVDRLCLDPALFGSNHPGWCCWLLQAHPTGRHRAAPAGAGEVPQWTHGEMLKASFPMVLTVGLNWWCPGGQHKTLNP